MAGSWQCTECGMVVPGWVEWGPGESPCDCPPGEARPLPVCLDPAERRAVAALLAAGDGLTDAAAFAVDDLAHDRATDWRALRAAFEAAEDALADPHLAALRARLGEGGDG